jgi:hypothetical protein
MAATLFGIYDVRVSHSPLRFGDQCNCVQGNISRQRTLGGSLFELVIAVNVSFT